MARGSNDRSSVTYPVRISPTRRHLVDRGGAPLLIHGDAAWSLISALTAEEVGQYLANRAAKGFNSIIVNLIEHKFNGPINRYGEGPFARPGDLTAPNERYFEFADWCIEKADEYGIQVFLAPIYLGYPSAADDEGWYHEVLAAGPDGCRQYGRYVGQRYARFDNIVWLMGGDRNPGEALAHVDAVVDGIKEFDNRHLFAAHAHPEHSPVIEYARGGWLDVNCTYTYGIVHRKLLADYNRKPVMPFLLIESTYEGEHNASAVQIRRQAYWAVLCGAAGQFFGNLPVWGFYGRGADMNGTQFADNEGRDINSVCEGWQAALDLPGSRDMAHVKALFASRPWYHLVPDQEHHVVIGGLGEFRGLDYVTAARTCDGGTVMAYLPAARRITVDLSTICGRRVRAWWFDPRTGEARPTGECPAEGPHEFAPRAEGDWVLVVDDAERGWPPPGQQAP